MPWIEYLFYPPGTLGPTFDRWGGVLFGAYVALAIGIALLAATMSTLNGRHGLKQRVTRRILYWGGGWQLVGILLLGLRVASIPILSMRLLLYAQLVGEAVLGISLWWWLQNRYPEQLAAYEWEDKKRAYLPRAAGGTMEPPRRKAAARRRR